MLLSAQPSVVAAVAAVGIRAVGLLQHSGYGVVGRVVVGEPITPPAPPADGPARRIARSATHAFNAQLRAALQAAFDDAGAQLRGAGLGSPGGASAPAPDRDGRADDGVPGTAGDES